MKKKIKEEIYFVGVLFLTLIMLILLLIPKDVYFTDIVSQKKVSLNTSVLNDDLMACYGSKFFPSLSHCKDITKEITKTGSVDTNKIGKYILVYQIDYKGVKKSIHQTIEVIDDEKPIIDLLGNETVIKCKNGKIFEPDFEVIDNMDLNLKEKVKKTIKEDQYIYKVKDSFNNETTATRKISYIDDIKPLLNINDLEIKLELNSQYIEPGYTVSDNCSEQLEVIVDGSVDTTVEGIYYLTYHVNDEAGNYTSETRKIIVGNPQINNDKTKIVYLTFDDGPGPNTERLLDVLKRYNVKATFFVTGQFSDYFDLITRIDNEGHVVALHTFSHSFRNIYSSEDNFFRDIDKLNNLIYEKTNKYSNIIRFAGGSSNTTSYFNRGIMTRLTKLVTEKGFYYFDWNVDSMDTSYKDSKSISSSVINGIKANKTHYVVLQHDIKPATPEAVEMIIKYGLDNGYTFKTLSPTSPITHHGINN